MKKELSASQKVKKELSKKFPDLKFSVTGGVATYIGKINVSIVEIKNSFINPVADYDHEISFVDLEDGSQISGIVSMELIRRGNSDARFGNYTGKTAEVIKEIFAVIEKYYGTHKAGDSMTDSFDNYFYDIDFGKWNKPLIYNGVSIKEIFANLEYAEQKEFPYKNIITTGVPTKWESFEELKAKQLEQLLALMPVSDSAHKADQDNGDFEAIFNNGKIEEFEHTKTGEILKVLKLGDRLSKEEFKKFNTELKDRGLGYYSRFAKGFILTDAALQKSA